MGVGELEPLARIGIGAYFVRELLGPSIQYLGRDVLPRGVEQGVENFGRVLRNAHAKLRGREGEPGGVPPRVLRGVLEEGFYAEEQIVTEYLGGVLASSRGGNSRDDRGVGYLALIARLSAYDLRLHYVAYASFHTLIAGSDLDVEDGTDLDTYGRVFIPEDALSAAMDYTAEEDGRALTDHSTIVLNTEGLIGHYGSGKQEYTAPMGAAGPGLVFCPSFMGMQLFLWAHGMTDLEGFAVPNVFGGFACVPPPEAQLLVQKPRVVADDS